MVSIFTGLGPGFERGSGATLGGLGVLGSGAKGLSGENVSLNAVTGNLLISRQDEFLVGRGPDAAINRTYNSLGALDENGDNWRMGTDRRVFSLTGTVNTAGSTVKRVSSDGSEITYTYRSGPGGVMAYWTTDGAGAHDRLTFSASVWTWTDGDSQISETYSAYGSYWRITRQADLDGNALTFTYTGANLNRVTTANQEYVEYSFTGNNLTQVKTGYTDLYYGGAKTLTRVRYGYDTSNRLTTVTVDLSPDDNAITDGKTYVTTYGYHLTTRLIKTIDQTDGSKVEFTYDGLNRVTQISQRATTADDRRLTLITYTAGRTDVTDPRNNVTSLFTDAAGRLTKITAPPAQTGATAQSVGFEYDTDGNVKKVTDAAGGITHYQYDSAGNTTQITDATGRITTRTYNARNSILTETVTGSTGAGPTTTLTSRYVYDVENHLVYSISAQGRVTRYIYNDDGTIPQVGESHTALYPVGTTAPTEVEMYNWWMGVDTAAGGNWASTTMRTSSYDARGNMTLTTYYGQGMVLTEGYYQKHAHYDQFGQMRFRQNVGENWEYFYYDGLGRLTSTQDQANATTSIVYNNAATQTVVTTASGYVTTKTYNKAGELISETDSGSNTTGGTATYSYDRNGQLRALKDATNRWTYFIYDKMGRKAADISQDGAVVEYRYDAAGRVAATARYNNRITVSATMKDPNGEVDLASVRPAAHTMDIWEWHVYDAAGRVVQKIIGDGSTTTYSYDSAGRLITTLGYFNKLTQAQVTGFKTTPPTATILPVLDTPAATSRDTVTRSFYDRDGLLIGMLDAAGGLTRMEYDGKGRKIAETRFAAIAGSTLWATGTFDQLVASITPNSRRDVTMRYVYNSMDQLRFTIDGLGRVTETLYFDGTDTGFAFKGPRRTIEHVTPIAALSTYTVATVKAAIASQANNANNRSTRLAYDVQGRLGYSIDANGAVVGYTYDSEGRVTETRQFATLINMSTMGVSSQWKTNIDTWVVTNSANVRVTRNFYAARGDVRFTMDAEGFVTQFDYDAEARLVTQRRFATALNLATVWTTDTVNSAAKGTASVTTFGYDNRGQLVDTWDANGTRRHTGYHSNGMRAWDIIAHTQTGELRHLTNYDGAGRYLNSQRIMGGVQSQIEVVTYDGLGNVATRGDANSTLTSFTYDKAGRVKTVRDALAGTTTYDYDAAGMGTKVTDARGNASYAYYDAAGQVVLTIDAEGFATRTTYNAFGEVATVTRHITKLAGTPSVDTQPTITTSTNDNVTTYTYDRLGRLSRVTDALGAYEEYTYNSFGQRLTSRNKLGGITTYTYDRRGLVVSEQLPVNNHLGQTIINRFEYDARGNRTKVTEAAGLAEQRITTYQYDAADRLTHKISEARQTIASGTANAVSLAPTEQYFYDRRGNVIEKRSPDGARQLYWYNNRNQVSHSLSALGILTQNIFDADGNVTETRVYETPVALPADATGAVPTGVGNFRVTQYFYDALNRVTEVRVPDAVTAVLNTTVVSGTSTTTLNVATRTLSTLYSYDALGNVTRTTDAEGRTVHSYYDKLGRKTSEVDQEQYRTDWTYDANSNVTRETRYATRLATAPTLGAAVPAVVTATADRITSFGYDKLGRRLWLQRANVQVHDSAANSGAGGAHRTTTSTINYAYNGLNQVVLKTEATGETVTNTYDVGGRLTRQRKSAFVDFEGTSVTPTIDYAYDGLGNLRTTTQLGQGDAAARVSTFVYGTGGLLVSATDAAGFVRTYRHDVAGRVTREEYARVDAWGNLTYEASGTDYDLEGRVLAKGIVMNPGNAGTWTRGDGRSNDTVQMKYNAFGEVVESGINGIVFEKNDFDKAGRLWRTNSGDGVWKYYLYNGTGQRTIAITSEGTDLANNTLDGVLNLWGANRDALRTAFVDGVTATLTRYDGRGMATEVLEPQRELNLSTRVNLTSNRGYNAFGELAWEQNAGGFRIDYGYNTMGRQIKIDSPSVQVTSEAGATTPQRLAEHRFYDVSGRLVASRDANGFITRMTLLGGTGYENNQAQVLRVDNPDGSYTENRYDIHGDLRVSVGPMSAGGQQGYITRFTYDRMGRKITATHPSTLIDTTNLVEYFSYDGLGQQIRKYNSFQGLTAAELTAYDQQGRVTYLRGAAGDITQTAYQFTDVGTWGLGTFGGWIKGTTFANGKTIREWTDVYGRNTASEDMSGRMTWNYFDMAGRVVRKNSNGTGSTDLNLSWYNTGKLAVQTHGVNLGPRTAWAIVATGYGYDAVGNLTQETTVRNGVRAEWEPPEPPLAGYWIYTDFIETVSDQRATYDALGRMLTWSEIGGNAGVLSAASTAWQYDANGNIRSVTSNFAKLNSFGVSEATTTKSDWFKYDSMNRVTLDRGIMLNGQIVRGANGITIAYNGRGERLYTLRGQEITAVPVVPPPPPPNSAPVATADTASGVINTTVSVSVLANDTDADGDPLSITAVSFDAARVQVTRVQNTTTGRFDSLSIVGLQLGATTITYTINDGKGGTATGTLTYTANPIPNRAPVAVADTASGVINTTVSVTVLSNDTDPDGDPLSITAVSFDAARVQVTRVQNTTTGRFDSLSIVGLQLGATSITYTISDGRGGTTTGTLTFTVTPIPNRAPVANADVSSGQIQAIVSVPVLSNDTDPDGDPLSITAVSFDASRVQVTRVQNTTTGRFDSLSIVGLQLGATNITYTISDGRGGTTTGTLTYTVNPPPNRAPVAVPDASSGQINTTVSVLVLSNDTDPDGDPLSITAVSFDASRVQVTRVQNTTTGRFDSLSIVGLQLGATNITYTISDGRGGTTTGTLTYTVNPPPNRAPVAVPDASSGQINTTVSVLVLSNDTDPDGDPLSITAVSFDGSRVQVTRVQNTTSGRFDSLSIVGLQLGATDITYTISDGRGGTTTGTLTYTVNPPPNRAPVAVPDASSGQINTTVSVLVLSNDTDPDGDPLSITAVSFDASRVQVTRVQNTTTGRFDSLSIIGLQLGATDITYTISDGRGGTTTGTLTYTVNPPPNRAPIANADTATGQINLAVPVFVLANDSDPDGDPLDITGLLYFDQRIVGVTRVLNNATGRYDRLEVTGRQIGAATINYTVGDGRGGLVSGVLSYTVTAAPPPPNAAPVANADSSSGQVLTTVYVSVLGNDTDPDGDALSITNVSFDSNFVQVTRSQNVSTGLFDGLFVTGSQVGNTNISYTISDGKGGQATGTLNHTVTPVPNRAPVANYDSASGQVLTTVSAYVLGNDTDPDGDPLSITDVSYDTNLVQVTRVQNASTGRFDRLDIVGLAVSSTNITYTISDGRGGQATGTLAFTTTPVPNLAPVANSDSASGEQWEAVLVDVLGNDTDPDGDPLSISRVTFDSSFVQVERLQNVATGRYVFLEVVGLRVGSTAITYQIVDGRGGSTSASLDFIVRSPPPPPPPPNRAPVANSETSSGQIQTTVYVPVLANDTDPDGDALTITDVSYDTNLVQVSRVQNSATGLFDGLYVTGSQVGNTNITYTISDGKGGQATGTLSHSVTPVPPPPPPAPNYGNYVLNYPDVYADFYLEYGPSGDMAAFGALHYQRHGAAEGRQLYWSTAPAPPNFAFYVLNHADLVIAFNQSNGAYGDIASFGARHYATHGKYEGRQVYWSQAPSPPPPPVSPPPVSPPPPPPGTGGPGDDVPVDDFERSMSYAMVGRSSMLVSAMAKSAPMAPMAAMSVTTVATTSFSGETGLNGFSSGIARDDYEYDSSGRLIAVYHNVAAFGAAEPTTKGGQVAAMAFDALGRMTRQTDFTGPGSSQVAVDRMVTYDLAGRVETDTTRTRQNDGQGNGLLIDNISTTTYDAIGTVLSVGTQTNRYRNANAYTGRIGEGQGAVWGTNTSSTTTYTYEWYQGAVQTGITYKEGSATRITTFTMANIAGQMVTKSVFVNDGRARTVTFDTDVSGQVIRRRESDNNYSQGDPSAMWYRFAGRQMGMITNNGGWEGSYAASVAQRQAAPATTAPGAFANGATVGKQEEQFSSNLEVINSYSQGSVAGSYVVRSGDSLQGIAQNLWGDSGLWYKLAEANGLSGAASLFEGQTLRLPAGVMRNTYNASSVTPYNPAETLGDVTPSTPQSAPPKKQKCGIAGQVLLVIIAVVVTYITKGATKEFFAGVFKAMGASATAAAAAATVASHATAAAIGSTVSQAVGVATGIQEKFSWKEVGAAFVSGGVASHSKATTNIIDAIIQGAKNSAISQAINVTLGNQDKFSWAAVAAAGVGGGVGYAVGDTKFARGLMASGRIGEAAGRALSGTAAVLASAATRSAIDGSDFGDSVRAAMPDILGGIIANFALSEGPLWTTEGAKEPLRLASYDGSQARRSQDDHREVIIVYGKKRGFFEAIMKRGADSLTGAYDDVTSGALQRGIQRWSWNNAKINGPRADGTYSPRDAYLINARLHASISALSALDAVTLFGKNGTTGGAAYDAFQNRSALGGLGVAIEVAPLLRAVPSAHSLGGMGAKAGFTVPTKAFDVIPEGPLAKLSTGSNTNVIGPPHVNGPNPFGSADFTVAGGVNFQVAVPTARVGNPGSLLSVGRNRVTFEGFEVRAVRDLSHIDDATLAAMSKKGFAAKLPNGDSIVLHHHRQNPEGFIVELPASKHSIGNVNQHPFGNSPGSGLSPQQRAEFNVWREDYWRARAREEIQRRTGGQ